MTEYKCKCGFKIDIPADMCGDEPLVSITEPKFRAFCAFCIADDAVLVFREDEGAVVTTACDFLRSDLSWEDYADDDDDWEAEE